MPRRADANLDQLAFDVAPIDTYREQRVAARLLRNDRRRVGVDEHDFSGYPGFAAFRTPSTPRCSSERSTRCCAADRGRRGPGAIRNTFRNWDYPIRRQIFSGFRCARDD